MICFRKMAKLAVVVTVFQALFSPKPNVFAAGPKISDSSNVGTGNKHNLSGLNINTNVTYKATADGTNNPRGQQICIFCHTPHSANVVGQAPLWNRKFSSDTFQRYSSTTLKIRTSTIPSALYGAGVEPSGSTKLCLSCHDGVSNMGELYSGPKIDMIGGTIPGVIDITSRASFNSSQNKLKFGHHPVSFVYTLAIADAINNNKPGVSAGTYKMPTELAVKLDKQSRMQCTTCHDAHQNQSTDTDFYPSPYDTVKIAPFWVLGGGSDASADQLKVCMTCHPMNAGYVYGDATKPWQTPP